MKAVQFNNSILISILILSSFFISGSSWQHDRNYFYLFNNSTFAPGSDVNINLYVGEKNKYKFSFKLLKVKDPVKFWGEKKNEDYYSRHFDVITEDSTLLLDYTELIREHHDKNVRDLNRETTILNIGRVDDPGIYIVQVMRGSYVAYCPVVVTNHIMIYKRRSNEILAFLANAKTGEFIRDAEFELYIDDIVWSKGKSDEDGLFYKDLSGLNDTLTSSLEIRAFYKDEVILSELYYSRYFDYSPKENLTSYIYTSQPVHRPGQTVNFKAIFREKTYDGYFPASGMEFGISVRDENNKEIYSSSAVTNEYGTLSGFFKLDEKAKPGHYIIKLICNGSEYYGSFEVDEFKKPEYKVTVTTDSINYSDGDTIHAEVSADYYFGSPVKNATVKVKIYKQHYWRPWWHKSSIAWFYYGYSKSFYSYSRKEMIYETEGELDSDGKLNFSYKVDSDSTSDYLYTIYAEVTDASRRFILGTGHAIITRGSFTISSSSTKYFYYHDEDVKIKVNTLDFSDKPVQTSFSIIFQAVRNWGDTSYMAADTINASTDESGSKEVVFSYKGGQSGFFKYKVVSFDDQRRKIISTGEFYVGSLYYYSRTETSDGIRILTDKETYEKGDSLTALVILPFEDQEVLLTFESDRIISYKKIKTDGNSFEVREKLTSRFAPGFTINVSFVKDRLLQTNSELIGVLEKDKLLNISLTPSQKIFKPGDTAEYNVDVRDQKGNPVKDTELSLGIIDESIYSIEEDITKPIEINFYSSRYSYIPIFNSLNIRNTNSICRKIGHNERHYFNTSYKEDAGDSKFIRNDGELFGKVKFENPTKKLTDIFVLLHGLKKNYSGKVDSLGNYHIGDIREGRYKVLIGKLGGGQVELNSLFIRDKIKLDLKLEKIHISTLETITVFGKKELINKNITNSNSISLISSDEISVLPVRGINNVESVQSGVVDEEYKTPDVRSNFVDALIWKAHIVTDNNGKAKVNFKIPDNLTTWRTTVRGITKLTEVGQKTDKFISRKDLLVRMETPRFFRQDDVLIISTNVHNYLSSSKKTKIEFESDKLTILGSKINSEGYENSEFIRTKFYEVEIPANSELRIDWKIVVDYPIGDAKLKVTALTNEESDAMEVSIPILPNGIKQFESLTAEYHKLEVSDTLSFYVPENTDLRSSVFSFTVNPSLAGTILKSLDELAGYPYGCVEQTMSRFLPSLVVANTYKEFNVQLNSYTINNLPAYVSAGLKRLYSMQHSDGGWGWWSNDISNPHMTSYVVYGLSLARQIGYAVDDNVYNRSVDLLKKQISVSGKSMDIVTSSYSLFVLSTALKDQNYDTLIYINKIDSLLLRNPDSYSYSLLALALVNMNQLPKAKSVIQKLKAKATGVNSLVNWEKNNSLYSWQYDGVQTTAFAVKAILNTEGNSQLTSRAIKWLLKRRQGFSWRSTQETAVVLFALTDYLKITKELEVDFSVKVFVNDKEIATKKFTAGDIYSEAITFDLSDKDLQTGKNIIRIEKSGNGSLYFSGNLEYYSSARINKHNESGISISREYFILEPKQLEDKIIYTKNKFEGFAVTGQDIFVKTTVQSTLTNMQYFIVEDMLPSGFEVVKDNGRYEIENESEYSGNQYYYSWRWFYADRDYHDEKVAFFVTNGKNIMEFTYIMKAQIPGDYSVMPSQGYLMYYPEIGGNSDVKKITVLDEKKN